MNKSISFFILVSLTLVLGLAGAIALVQSGQDTRSSASFITSGTLSALPANSSVRVGDEFKINFAVENTTAAVNTFQITACYDSTKVKLVESKITTGDFLPDIKQALTINSKPCYTVVGHIMNAVSSPLINLSSLTFQALAEGTGTIELLKDNDRTGIAGVSTTDDKVIALTAINSANYTIAAALPAQVCVAGTKECTTIAQSRECVNNAWVTTNCNSTQNCVNGTCQTKSAENSIVSMKLAFAGVKANNDQCASTLWPMNVKIVDENNNVITTAEGVVPQKINNLTNTKGEIVYKYDVSVPNNKIPASGLASVFLQGSKHVSVKYGENAQTAWYRQYKGALSLVSGTNNYDFSLYSMLAGDVNGDGKINGQDFSIIKEKSQPITTGEMGKNLYADIDGNCQVNTGDVRLIKESLTEINGQTY